MTVVALPGAASTALTVTEWDLPETPVGWLMLFGVGAALILYVLFLGRRDTRTFPLYITVFLAALRLGVIVALAIISAQPARANADDRQSAEPARRPDRHVALDGRPGTDADLGIGHSRRASLQKRSGHVIVQGFAAHRATDEVA